MGRGTDLFAALLAIFGIYNVCSMNGAETPPPCVDPLDSPFWGARAHPTVTEPMVRVLLGGRRPNLRRWDRWFFSRRCGWRNVFGCVLFGLGAWALAEEGKGSAQKLKVILVDFYKEFEKVQQEPFCSQKC